jgi:hypothetical protein
MSRSTTRGHLNGNLQCQGNTSMTGSGDSVARQQAGPMCKFSSGGGPVGAASAILGDSTGPVIAPPVQCHRGATAQAGPSDKRALLCPAWPDQTGGPRHLCLTWEAPPRSGLADRQRCALACGRNPGATRLAAVGARLDEISAALRESVRFRPRRLLQFAATRDPPSRRGPRACRQAPGMLDRRTTDPLLLSRATSARS